MILIGTFIFELTLILGLIVMPKLGDSGKKISVAFARAPGLDLIILMLMPIPWLVGSLLSGWLGLLSVLAGQIFAMQTWIFFHELSHHEATKGPRIVKFLNQEIGWWRNYLGLWLSTLALPMFLMIRVAEIAVYPFLASTVDFPQYEKGEWVNVSRHKFEGLVGHDLIWCWYCDWMTGVYSLGAEMLRNVESFWCPIRFYDDKKCENCKLDFPDLDDGWVDADCKMEDVVKLMESKYSDSHHSWFGHPERQDQRRGD